MTTYRLIDVEAEKEHDSENPVAVLSSLELSMGIINALVGTALLIFPRLAHLNGIAVFSVVVALCGFTLYGSMILLTKCTEMTNGEVSLHELTRLAFETSDANGGRSTWLSRTLPIVVDICVFIDCFLGNVLYINFISHFVVASNSVLHGFRNNLTLFNYKIGIGIICLTLTVVTGDALSKLRWTNTVGFVALVLTTFFTIVSPLWLKMEFDEALSPDATTEELRLLNMCEAFSIAGYALVNYFCATSFYAESKNKQKFTPVVFSTFVLLIMCFILYGVFGAASIGSETFFMDSDQADIFPYYYIFTTYTSPLMKKVTGVVFITLSVTLITKVPVYTLPMVDAVKEIYIQIIPKDQKNESFGWVFNMVSKILIGGTQIVVALYCNDLSRIMTLESAIVLTPLSYLFPAAIYVRLSNRKCQNSFCLTLFACFIVVIGISLWVYALAEIVHR